MSYSPTLGRFLECDPIGYDDGMNPYQFVGSNPVEFVDPSGLAEEKIVDPGENRLKIPVNDKSGHVGTVEVNKDVVLQYASGDGAKKMGDLVSMSYKGTNCEKTTWVQFFWVEIFVSRQGVRTRKAGTIKTAAGDVTLTKDPENPVWYVDATQTDKTPAYDESGLSLPDKKSSNTIFDRPFTTIPNLELLQDDVKDATVSNIQAVKHFAAYLVADGNIIAGFHWSESNAWNQKTNEYGFRIDIPNDQKGDLSPNASQLKALQERFPQQKTMTVKK